MTNHLQTLYRERAANASPAPDLDEVMTTIRERGEQYTRRRRNVRAAGGGVIAVAALVGTLLLVGGPGGDSANGPAAGPGPGRSLSADQSRMADKHRLAGLAERKRADERKAAQRRAAQRRAAERSAARVAPRELVTAAAAPKPAPLSLGLLPDGYRYLGAGPSATTYGEAGTDGDPNSFVGKLAVLVGERYDHKTARDRIAGYPAAISAQGVGSDIQWMVELQYDTKVVVTIQVPRAAGLSRTQVRAMAATIVIRDVSHPTHG